MWCDAVGLSTNAGDVRGRGRRSQVDFSCEHFCASAAAELYHFSLAPAGFSRSGGLGVARLSFHANISARRLLQGCIRRGVGRGRGPLKYRPGVAAFLPLKLCCARSAHCEVGGSDRLQNAFKTPSELLQNVFEMLSKRFQNVFKTPSKMPSKRLQNAFKMPSKRIRNALKTP